MISAKVGGSASAKDCSHQLWTDCTVKVADSLPSSPSSPCFLRHSSSVFSTPTCKYKYIYTDTDTNTKDRAKLLPQALRPHLGIFGLKSLSYVVQVDSRLLLPTVSSMIQLQSPSFFPMILCRASTFPFWFCAPFSILTSTVNDDPGLFS